MTEPATDGFDGSADRFDIFRKLAETKDYPTGRQLFSQGSPADEVYLIELGLVKLNSLDHDGREIIVGLRSPGWMLGTASAIVRKPHPFSGVVLLPSRILRMPASQFVRLVRTDQRFSWQLHQSYNREVYEQLSQLVALRCLSARQRLEQLLVRMARSVSRGEGHRNLKLRLPLRNWEMAQLIGVTPEHLSRVLKLIERDGCVRREGTCLVIPDVHNLHQPADQ